MSLRYRWVCNDYILSEIPYINASWLLFCHFVYYYFRTGAAARGQAYYGQGTNRIWLDNVHCTGAETSITQCPSNGWGVHNCAHQEDVGVSCQASMSCFGFELPTLYKLCPNIERPMNVS